MRFAQLIAAGCAVSLALPAVPALAQEAQQQQPSVGRQILDTIVNRVLRTETQPANAATKAASAQMQAVLAHPRRDGDRARDAWRHPAETLDFFQVRPGMTVVDFMPAGGWYSRVLIPYLGQGGTYIGLNPEVPAHLTGGWDNYRDAASKLPASARTWVGNEGARVIGLNTDNDLAPYAGSVDRVLIIREMHNIRRMGFLHDTLVATRTLLKPDGMVGIVQHRAKADAPSDYVLGDKGYQREADIIALMSAYGFELAARSEVNANPADPANWEGGVWSLPPAYGGAPEGSEERARRAQIGESDRMTLLFRKRP